VDYLNDADAARTAADQMAVCLAREVREGEFVFHGVNSPLPLVAIYLAKRLHAPGAVLIEIAGAADPRPRRLPFSTNDPRLCEGAAAAFSNPDAYDLFARGGIDLMFLGGAQIDKAGRVNMSYIGDPGAPKVRLPGGGGGSVIMAQAGRTVIWRAAHDARTFVDKVDFVTQTGRLTRIVTPLAVFEMREGGLELGSVHPGASPGEVAERTGFPLNVSETIPETYPPSAEELAALGEIDPEGVRYSEFAALRRVKR
jgi:glutaconate CoA-transferase subunit B